MDELIIIITCVIGVFIDLYPLIFKKKDYKKRRGLDEKPMKDFELLN